MTDYLKGLFGAASSSASSALPSDADFADFASPSPVNHGASSAFSAASETQSSSAYLSSVVADRPYTKWYRVWERVTIQDFYQELVIIPVIILVVLVNLWGTRANRAKAKKWISVHAPILESEFSSVGFDGTKNTGGAQAPEDLIKEKSKYEYITYATGRQNTAFLDVKITLWKRYNPIIWFGEIIVGFFLESMPAPVERVESTAWCFDGKEKALVPGERTQGNKDSSFDGFVWAVVHKDKMKQLRDDRYDLSLTTTKDHPKLPVWATIMSESAEVTDAMLTPDLLKAIEQCDEALEALIVTDQPIDAPKTLNDTVPKKRVSLSMHFSSSPAASTALFSYFVRLPDHLANTAHFRPEAMRNIRATREKESKKIRKADEDEKAEERKLQGDKLKKEERERKLGGMSAAEQKKFLEREREKDQKKGMKRKSVKG